MSTLKAALFDLDGVVFDTEPQYSIFWGSQCRLYHPERPGLEHEIKGQTLTQIYDQWFSGPLEKEQPVITDRLNEYESHMHYDYIEGFEQMIADLRAHGVKTAVVTSSNLSLSRCSMLFLPVRISSVVSPIPIAISKPPRAWVQAPMSVLFSRIALMVCVLVVLPI